MVALAAPLPATVPSTLVAANGYRKAGLIDRTVLRWSLIAGVPATILGAVFTRWVDAGALITVTEVLILGLGLKLFLGAATRNEELNTTAPARVAAVAATTGLAAGLLANSGGFLLAPLFVAVLGLGIKPALGTSLLVASVLAVPGSMVHLMLGHLDAGVVFWFGLGAIPLSGLGSKLARRIDSSRLEKGYGLLLVAFGAAFLFFR